MSASEPSLVNHPIHVTPASNRRFPAVFRWLWQAVGNPFFLLSPVLMLYGVFLVATDPQMLGEEERSLAFNFSSLTLYELLLVVTAIWLARRRLRYDAGVLVWMENLLLFVPFMLLSQASFLSGDAALRYAAIGLLLAIARWVLHYRWFPEIHLPRELLALGGLLLLMNAAFPLIYHRLVTLNEDNWTWPAFSYVAWMLLFPTIAFAGNWLCRPVAAQGDFFRSRWLPVSFFAVWLAGTVVNLRAINYVDGAEFRQGLVVPLVWSLSWVIWLQTQSAGIGSTKLRERLLWVPVLLPLVAGGYGEQAAYLAMVGANALAMIGVGDRVSGVTRREVCVASLVLAVAGMPDFIGEEIVPFFSRPRCVALAIALGGVWIAARQRDAMGGLAAGVIFGLANQIYFKQLDYLEQFAMDSGMMFVLLHSLWWSDAKNPVGRPVRFAVGLGWLVHGIVWIRIAGGDVPETAAFIRQLMPLSGMLVLAVCVAHRLHVGRWHSVSVPAFAVLSAVTVPLNSGVEVLRIAPTGHLAVLGSFIVLALGAAFAVTRERMAREMRDCAEAVRDQLAGGARELKQDGGA